MQYSKMSAEKLLEALEITSAPVRPYSVAEKIGITVKSDLNWDKLGYDGEIYLDKEHKPEIWISPTIPANRQNFTLAHEIAHLVLDVLPNIDDFKDPIKDDYSTLRRDGSKNLIELKANSYAAQLLMPKSFVLQAGEKLIEAYQSEFGQTAKISIEEFIEKMALLFEVSKDAMKYRLLNLGVIQNA